MRADIQAMIDKTDSLTNELNEFATSINQILDRGNKPTTSLVDDWSEAAHRSVVLLDELKAFAAFLQEDAANVTTEEITALAASQLEFHVAQTHQDAVIRRMKKALGIIP